MLLMHRKIAAIMKRAAMQKRRRVVITSGSDERSYEGKTSPLTLDEYTLTGDGIDPQDTLTVNVTGRQTFVGSSSNEFDASISSASGIEYEIEKVYGTLRVTDENVDADLVVNMICDDRIYSLGEEVTFDIDATNIYAEAKTITLTEVDSVTLSQSVFEDVSSGGRVDTTAIYTMTEADILSGSFTNTVTAQLGNITKTAQAAAEAEEPVSHLTVTLMTTSTPADEYAYVVGETATFELEVINDGNLTITQIAVAFNAPDDRTISTYSIESLAPGARSVFSDSGLSYAPTVEDAVNGEMILTATATGRTPDPNAPNVPYADVDNAVDPEPVAAGEGAMEVYITETSTPANGTAYTLGETVSYEIVIENAAVSTLSNLSVNAEVEGHESVSIDDSFDVLEIAYEEYATGTYSHTVTEQDILAGGIALYVEASAEDLDGSSIEYTGDITSDVEAANPSLYVSPIETTSEPEDSEGYAAGEYIEFTTTIQNNGNVTVSGITAVCELTNNNWTVASLAPGEESEPLDGEYEVSAEDSENGSVEIEITADGTSDSDEPVNQGYASISVPTIAIEFDPEEAFSSSEAYAISEPANGETYALGEEIKYYIKIVNSSEVTLTDVVVDDYLTGDQWTIDLLEPGETKDFTSEYTVTEMDVLAGHVVNEVIISPKDPNGEPFNVPALEVESLTDGPNPSITMVIDTTSTPANGNTYALDECIDYKFTIRNDGNLTLTNIRYGSELTGDEWQIECLEPGDSPETESGHRVRETDILKGSVTCDAWYRASTHDPDNPTISEYEASTTEDPVDDPDRHLTAACRVTSHPANGNAYALGETVTWQHPVTNDGNLTIYSIRLTANPGGSSWDIKSPRYGYTRSYLAPNEVSDSGITASYVVAEADILRGYIEIEPEITGAVDVEGTECAVDPGGIQVLTEDSN